MTHSFLLIVGVMTVLAVVATIIETISAKKIGGFALAGLYTTISYNVFDNVTKGYKFDQKMFVFLTSKMKKILAYAIFCLSFLTLSYIAIAIVGATQIKKNNVDITLILKDPVNVVVWSLLFVLYGLILFRYSVSIYYAVNSINKLKKASELSDSLDSEFIHNTPNNNTNLTLSNYFSQDSLNLNTEVINVWRYNFFMGKISASAKDVTKFIKTNNIDDFQTQLYCLLFGKFGKLKTEATLSLEELQFIWTNRSEIYNQISKK
ncbi:hypothetical protein [Mycoplasma simbae]|uniref:hypothetical protein n=1 Tax=Mycoplasma simbae TaxID=36744 RepID=UPI0004982A7C|nr:hypothetical protein [Mycoplasma simbae]